MLIKACLNGSRTLEEHPALPNTPEELTQAAVAAVAEGAGALHIHPRDASGAQTLAVGDQAAALTAIRARLPTIPIGVSTAEWIEPDVARRLAAIHAWQALPLPPDFASVNFSEAGAELVCEALLAVGIGVEAGLAAVDDAQRLLASGLAPRCLRILIE
ncbi:MAG: 3-keto-5-aminohexanoate cleavage protein, partial [Ktedonobacterales bacterium]